MNAHPIYSTDLRGPFALYVYGADGRHSGKQYFERRVRYPDEEITSVEARRISEAAIAQFREVRVTNAGDELIFHSLGSEVIHPVDPEAFWKAVGA